MPQKHFRASLSQAWYFIHASFFAWYQDEICFSLTKAPAEAGLSFYIFASQYSLHYFKYVFTFQNKRHNYGIVDGRHMTMIYHARMRASEVWFWHMPPRWWVSRALCLAIWRWCYALSTAIFSFDFKHAWNFSSVEFRAIYIVTRYTLESLGFRRYYLRFRFCTIRMCTWWFWL